MISLHRWVNSSLNSLENVHYSLVVEGQTKLDTGLSQETMDGYQCYWTASSAMRSSRVIGAFSNNLIDVIQCID